MILQSVPTKASVIGVLIDNCSGFLYWFAIALDRTRRWYALTMKLDAYTYVYADVSFYYHRTLVYIYRTYTGTARQQIHDSLRVCNCYTSPRRMSCFKQKMLVFIPKDQITVCFLPLSLSLSPYDLLYAPLVVKINPYREYGAACKMSYQWSSKVHSFVSDALGSACVDGESV